MIRMKSITACCTCPKCGQTTKNYHGTYMRKVQDLPILGKNVQLETTAHEYNCMNKECNTTSISETFDGFLNAYSRMTERCAVFVFIQTLILSKLCFKNDINYSDIKSKGLDFIFHGMINQKKKGG